MFDNRYLTVLPRGSYVPYCYSVDYSSGACLGVDHLDPETSIGCAKENALTPPPSHRHLYIIHLINWLQRFYRITMSLKIPFVPKSDVKQIIYYYYYYYYYYSLVNLAFRITNVLIDSGCVSEIFPHTLIANGKVSMLITSGKTLSKLIRSFYHVYGMLSFSLHC